MGPAAVEGEAALGQDALEEPRPAPSTMGTTVTVSRSRRPGPPAWPSGLPTMSSPWTSFAPLAKGVTYLSVWRLDGGDGTRWFTVPGLAGQDTEAELLYRRGAACDFAWSPRLGRLSVALPSRYTARVFRIVAR